MSFVQPKPGTCGAADTVQPDATAALTSTNASPHARAAIHATRDMRVPGGIAMSFAHVSGLV